MGADGGREPPGAGGGVQGDFVPAMKLDKRHQMSYSVAQGE
jgi:hypothetical protein